MNVVDHRVRVAALRRERMRMRLMEAALQIFGEGVGGAGVIDDVIQRAKVSRGTFYNYFKNPDELLKGVAFQTGTELMHAAAPIVESREDPAERVAASVRSWLSLVEQHPHVAAFFRRAGLFILESDQVRADFPRDLVAGINSGRFTVKEFELGFVLVAGTVLAAINTQAIGAVPDTYGSKLAERVLMSLGIEEGEAHSIAHAPIDVPQLPPDSLIARSRIHRARRGA